MKSQEIRRRDSQKIRKKCKWVTPSRDLFRIRGDHHGDTLVSVLERLWRWRHIQASTINREKQFTMAAGSSISISNFKLATEMLLVPKAGDSAPTAVQRPKPSPTLENATSLATAVICGAAPPRTVSRQSPQPETATAAPANRDEMQRALSNSVYRLAVSRGSDRVKHFLRAAQLKLKFDEAFPGADVSGWSLYTLAGGLDASLNRESVVPSSAEDRDAIREACGKLKAILSPFAAVFERLEAHPSLHA